MGNSKLVTYTNLSPNCYRPRNNKIDKIVIHHMAAVWTVEQCGNSFSVPSRQASSNYGVDGNGDVGLFVEESNASWASGDYFVDNRAITIEVANDVAGGNWHVSDTALEKTIELCVDICERNGIEQLIFTGNQNGNLVMHRYYSATACPGEYLASKFPYIADEVNKRLKENQEELTMTQYEELKTLLNGINDRLAKLEGKMIYNYIDKNMPDWARHTIQKMVDKKILVGDEKGELGLTDEMLRTYVILDRAGTFGE